MIDHVSVAVSDIEVAASFYDAVLATLHIRPHAKFDNVLAYGKESIGFLVMLAPEHSIRTTDSSAHIAFSAKTVEQVDDFYRAALSFLGACEGRPGLRDYPQGEVYTAYVRDNFGNKLEAIFKYPSHQA